MVGTKPNGLGNVAQVVRKSAIAVTVFISDHHQLPKQALGQDAKEPG
jgi:single-stranded DNA-specific DHH superfamily exonuclease